MWPFKRRPQAVVMIDQAALTAAIVDALKQTETDREKNEIDRFQKDDASQILRGVLLVAVFVLGLFFLFSLSAFLPSCFGVRWGWISFCYQFSTGSRIWASIISAGYLIGCIALFSGIRKIHDRVLFLAYTSTLVSMVGLLVSLIK